MHERYVYKIEWYRFKLNRVKSNNEIVGEIQSCRIFDFMEFCVVANSNFAINLLLMQVIIQKQHIMLPSIYLIDVISRRKFFFAETPSVVEISFPLLPHSVSDDGTHYI